MEKIIELDEQLRMTDTSVQVQVFSLRTGLLKRLEDADGRVMKKIVHHRPKYRVTAIKFEGLTDWIEIGG